MRQSYIITYDIRDPKRLRKVFKTCKGFGLHLQYSVFECDLTDAEMAQFQDILSQIIHHGEDQILFIDLGPASSRGERVITAMGESYHKIDEPCFVV